MDGLRVERQRLDFSVNMVVRRSLGKRWDFSKDLEWTSGRRESQTEKTARINAAKREWA